MAISDKKALEAAQTITEFCREQRGCQNCIFHKYGASEWKCHFNAYVIDMQDIMNTVAAKKKHRGYTI